MFITESLLISLLPVMKADSSTRELFGYSLLLLLCTFVKLFTEDLRETWDGPMSSQNWTECNKHNAFMCCW